MSATERLTINVILEVNSYAMQSEDNLKKIEKVLQLMARPNRPDEEIQEALFELNPRGVTRLGWNIGGEEILLYPFVQRIRSSS